MGIEVKSHMSPVDDATADKVRLLFRAEVAAVKQKQEDRKTFQQKIVITKEKTKVEQPQPIEKPIEAPVKIVKSAPVFIEKEIVKEERKSKKEEPVHPPKPEQKTIPAEQKPAEKQKTNQNLRIMLAADLLLQKKNSSRKS